MSVCYLGEGVFWEVLVGEVTGLDQLAGDRGVWRVRGLPIGAWWSRLNKVFVMSIDRTHKRMEYALWVSLTCATLPVFLRWFWSSLVAPSWKVLGRAASSMLNSGVLSWNSAISTDWAACKTEYSLPQSEESTHCFCGSLNEWWQQFCPVTCA